MAASNDAAYEFRPNPPTATFSAEPFSNVTLPTDYIDFLRRSNGGEGFLPNGAYAAVFRFDELHPHNRDYQIEKCIPGLFLFGSDGGGEGYCFDLRTAPASVVQIPFVGMALDTVVLIARTFSAFMAGDWSN